MTERYSDLVQRLRASVLQGRGVTDPALRQAVASRASALGGGAAGREPAVPPDLSALVDKIARRAYTVTDADVQAVRQAGYSEDAVFEITAAAAMGAALGRLERGMAALTGRA
jgi:alkylhydroperoxidase family enzyme